MTEREKIIDVCQPILNFCNANGCKLCLYEAYKPFCISTAIADNLLKNGVIVPLVKVGDPLFTVAKVGVIIEHEVIQIRISDKGVVFDCISKTLHGKDFCFSNDLIGKTVFFTHEEAEKALAKITKNK